MYKFIWMTDIHYSHQGNVLGHDPRTRLQTAIDYINTHHSDAEICLVTGDMVQRGEMLEYQALRDQLHQLRMPYLPMAGNHDNPEVLRQWLPLPSTCMDEFIQYTVPASNTKLVCLDTHKKDSSAGELCTKRREWLRTVLSDNSNHAVYLFMHHPPMNLGLPMQDIDKLEDAETFIDLITEFTCVNYLFLGHVHRPITGVIKGVPFSTMHSVLAQAPPPRPEWNWDTFKPSADAPCLGVVTLSDSEVSVHYEQFTDNKA